MHFRFATVLVLLSLSLSTHSITAERLAHANTEIIIGDQSIQVKKNGRQIIDLQSIQFNYRDPSTWKIKRQTKNSVSILLQYPAEVNFLQHPDNDQSLDVELTISKTDSGFRFYAAPQWAHHVTLVFNSQDEHFFGLSEPLQPDNQLSPDLRGALVNVDINSENATMYENYASAFSSFYLSSLGYGAFFDSFARGRYEFDINGKNRILHDGPILDWYIFVGDDGTSIHSAYFKLIGAPKKVPVWALGPIGWRDQNNGGAAEIVDDIARMSELQIPFTAWFVDRPYSDGAHAWSKLNFANNFANPQDWIKTLREDFNLEFMTWVATSTFGDMRFPRHLAGKFSYLDLSDPRTVASYQQELNEKQHQVGVRGHKIDRADEGFAEQEDWADATPLPERRNKYAYLMAKVHDEALRKAWGDDQFTFARTAIHRTQPYLSAIWGGDPRTNWNGLQGNLANAIRSSYMGFPVWGTDVGGYQGEGYIPEDLYIRWMQFGSMSGLFEIKLDGAGGDGRDRMPWRYDAEFQQRFKKICEERIAFLPYLYSLVQESGNNGVLMKPLAYKHLQDKATYAIWDQFYFGDAIMVAPIVTKENRRKVYLPKGLWRDFDESGRFYQGGKTIEVESKLDTFPRFVKSNSLYLTSSQALGNQQLWHSAEGKYFIHAFPDAAEASAHFTLHIPQSQETATISLQSSKRSVTLSSQALPKMAELEITLLSAPQNVMVNGIAAEHRYSESEKLLRLSIKANTAFELTIKK